MLRTLKWLRTWLVELFEMGPAVVCIELEFDESWGSSFVGVADTLETTLDFPN